MTILNIDVNEVGEVGVTPRTVKIKTNNTLAEVTAVGFLNDSFNQGFKFQETDICLVTTSTVSGQAPTQSGWFEATLSGGSWSLVSTGSPGSVTLPTVSNELAIFNNTTGGLSTSGVLLADVQLNTNIIAATTADIGGAGAGPLTVSVTGLTAASVVVASIESSTNAVSLVAVTAGAAGFDVTCSADPGAALLVNYVAFVAAQ